MTNDEIKTFFANKIDALEKENKTLKEALRLACDDIYFGAVMESGVCPHVLALMECEEYSICLKVNFACNVPKCWQDHFIHQATPEGG